MRSFGSWVWDPLENIRHCYLDTLITSQEQATLPIAAGHDKSLCWMLLLTAKEGDLRQSGTLQDQIFTSNLPCFGL